MQNTPKRNPEDHCGNDWAEGKIKAIKMVGGKEEYVVAFEKSKSTQGGDVPAEMKLPVEDVEWMILAHQYLNKKIAKKFDQGTFEGSVTDVKPADGDYDSTLFTILYEDGDIEDFSEEESIFPV